MEKIRTVKAVSLSMILVILMAWMLTACGVKQAEPFTLQVSINNGEQTLFNDTVTPDEGNSLLQTLEKSCKDVVNENGLITSIEGHAQSIDENIYWFYTVNGEFATVGAGDYVPKKGDVVVFDLHESEF